MSPFIQQDFPPAFVPTCLLLDLDDTLYQVAEIPDIVRKNIQDYMGRHLGIPRDKIAPLCLEYYTNYGTTMAGLVANGYQIDFDHWHEAVHGTLPYERLLKRDDRLRRLLLSIRVPKFVFTNADRKHADRCLGLMGVADLFEDIICFESLQLEGEKQGLVKNNKPVICKPNKLAIEMALAAAGADAATTIFCDDSVRNINGARSAGVFSVLVGRTGSDSSADLEVPSLHDLHEALPGLWAVPPSSSPVLAGHWPPSPRGHRVPAVMRAQGCETEEEARLGEFSNGGGGGSCREAGERTDEQLREESGRQREIEVAAGR